MAGKRENRGGLATKADLAATKSELKSDVAAVRDDLAATKSKLESDIAGLKSDVIRLDGKIDRVAVDVVRLQVDVREIKETMATKDDVTRILSNIDAFAKKAEAYDRKSWSHGDIPQSPEAAIRDHDRRLSAPESKSS